jgi:Tfp pilus assembly protein PilN
MIRINLLPEDYRRAERTSPKVFAAVLLSVIVVCCSFGWLGYMYFGELGRLNLEFKEVDERFTNLQKQVAYHNALANERKDFEQREKTIQDISQSRVLWTKVLDQLIDTVNNDGNIDRHMAWFDRIVVQEGRGKGAGPTVEMPGFVQGEEFKRLGDFHDDLERAPFFTNVVEKDAPSGVVKIDEEKTPKEALQTTVKWTFLPPAKWIAPTDIGTANSAPGPR